MRLRLLLRKLTISAPHMRVRTQRPWYLQIAPFIAVSLVSILLVMAWYEWLANRGGKSRSDLEYELVSLRASVVGYAQEQENLRRIGATATSQIQMEQAAREQLTKQMRALEADNARLREEVAFFERAVATNQARQGLSISTARIEKVGSNQYQFRLMVTQGGKTQNSFIGELQILVSGSLDGKPQQIPFPLPATTDTKSINPNADGNSPVSVYQLNFRHYQHIEGQFTLPQGMQITSIQAKIRDKQGIRLTQALSF